MSSVAEADAVTPEAVTPAAPESPFDVNQIAQILVAQSEGLLNLANEIAAQSPSCIVEGPLEDLGMPDKRELVTQAMLVKAQSMQQVLSALQRVQCMIYGVGIQFVGAEVAQNLELTKQVEEQNRVAMDDIAARASEGLPRQTGDSSPGAADGAS